MLRYLLNSLSNFSFLSNENSFFLLILGMTLYNLVVLLKQHDTKDYLFINLLLLVAGFFSNLVPSIFKLFVLAQIFANLIILSRIYNTKYVVQINKIMNFLIFAAYSISIFSKINLILVLFTLIFFMYLLLISNGGNKKEKSYENEDYDKKDF